MKGCNERCAFCIVPHTRGPERYRPAAEIVDEVRRLVAAGTREVTLLGQTVNSYRDPRAIARPGAGRGRTALDAHAPDHGARGRKRISRATSRACGGRPGAGSASLHEPAPASLTRSLILAHRDLPVLARHVHLPVQSGSDRLLRRMIRRYSSAEYRERVAALRAEVPDVTLSTDVIVGFPGETREDFTATLELVQEMRFSGLFGFKYSPVRTRRRSSSKASRARKRRARGSRSCSPYRKRRARRTSPRVWASVSTCSWRARARARATPGAASATRSSTSNVRSIRRAKSCRCRSRARSRTRSAAELETAWLDSEAAAARRRQPRGDGSERSDARDRRALPVVA